MTPSELWASVFGEIAPGAFWARAVAEDHVQQADEAVDLALAGAGLEVGPEDAEVLSRYLAASVPGVPHGASQVMHLPGW